MINKVRWATVLGLAVGVLAACSAPAPSAAPGGGAGAGDPAAPGAVRVLQLNLCNSGIASCFTDGRAVTEAADILRDATPDLVTLSEVCDSDVTVLEQALAEVTPAGTVSSAFTPARDDDTGESYRCADGREYGIGTITRADAADPPRSGIHPTQDPEDPEQRAWLCLDVPAPGLGVCTSHLAYTDVDVTTAQCRYLVDTVLTGREVLAGDLNLAAGNPNLESCLPADAARADDGGPQHVVAPPGLAVTEVARLDLRGATDHPGLLVTLAPR